MPGEHYTHIFLGGPSSRRNFTNPRRGGSSPRIPARDRARHSAYLQQRLEQAWDLQVTEATSTAAIHVERQGTYIEFLSEPGFELVVQSLEDRRSGIRLQNVREVRTGDSTTTLATVYVPNQKRAHFLRKILAYANENTGSSKPKHEKLINSVSDIRRAVLKSFWRSEEWAEAPTEQPDWVEVWLSGDTEEVISRFGSIARVLELGVADDVLKFPERTVKLVRATRQQLERLIENSDDIAEFRIARRLASFFIELENRDQMEHVRDLLARCSFNDDAKVAVCILDTGVNNAHLLLKPVLNGVDLHTAKPEWGTHDHHGHGTLMAGTVAYGDLLALLGSSEPVQIHHRLESAKILPPPTGQNPKRLWGYFTAQGLSRAEIQAPDRTRVACMAITSTDDRDQGRPSSWSGAIDELASGSEDDKQRLIIVSAGNVSDSRSWLNYPNDNLTNEVHDPGQAWNALTVGASTEKTSITNPALSSYTAVARSGELSPHSSTSVTWSARRWPIKPEVVFEGGNVAVGPNGSVFDTEDLTLISTSHDPQVAQFAPFCATSAAAAQAAWMAAQILSRYPLAWPETVRALIVHSAGWTSAIKRQFLPSEPNKADIARLLRICGYGKPDLERALYSMAHSLTLISETTLQPYDKKDGRYITRDMHLYELPWPTDVLADLGELQVSMRVTLSYFVEPGPGEIGWEDRYRYASHALRFDVNGSGESKDEFVGRVNTQARIDGEHPGTEGARRNWIIGEARNVGSIHSDIWQGTAADLAGSNLVAVYPGVGWWRERQHLNRWDRKCRYSLIISIHTPEQNIDVYTPVLNQIGVKTTVDVATS